MAWQTPKTDWAAADGVRNTDFNRIESNILELYNTESLKNTLLVYVSTSGNDTTGTGAAGAPYRTITKALSVIPKNLAGRNASITIAAGTYSEAVTVGGFSGGSISLTGISNANITLTSLTINSCVVFISSINVITTAPVGIIVNSGGALVASTSNITCSGSSVGVRVTGCSRAHLAGTVHITNANTAIDVSNCSSTYIGQLTGSNVSTGISSIAGSVAAYNMSSITVKSTAMYTASGGRIYNNAQASVPTY